MIKRERTMVETALKRHYDYCRPSATPDDISELAALMLEEDERARMVLGRNMSTPGFVCAQVRFVPAWVWAAQVCIVAVMVWISLACGDTLPVRWAIGAMSAASVLVCTPTVLSSKHHGVTELEYACRFDAARVLAARLLILGCSCSLAVGLMVAGTSAATGLGALAVALWACPPYFCSCAVALAALRRLNYEAAVAAAVAWIASVCGALLIASEVFPVVYGAAALAVWGLAAAAALAWLAHETATCLRCAALRLDPLVTGISQNHV